MADVMKPGSPLHDGRMFNSADRILPCEDALYAKRVCKLWQATFCGSHKLKVALCLTPVKLPSSRPTDKAANASGTEISQIHVLKVGPMKYQVYVLDEPCARDAYIDMRTYAANDDIIANPILRKLFSDADHEPHVLRCTTRTLSHYFKTQTAVWSSMYMTQPPVKELFLDILVDMSGKDDSREEYEDKDVAWIPTARETGWLVDTDNKQLYQVDAVNGFKVANGAGVKIADLIAALREVDKLCEEADEFSTMGFNIMLDR